MVSNLKNVLVIPHLRNRLFITLIIIVIFRLIAQVPLVNVNQAQLNQLLANNAVLGWIDLLAGGKVVTNFSIMAAGLVPYIVANVIVSLLVNLIPALQRMSREEGAAGRQRLELYTKLLSIPLAFAMAWGISEYLNQRIGLFPGGVKFFSADTFLPSMAIVTTMTAGSLFSGWLTDRITESGVGNGASVLIGAGACLTLAEKARDLLSNQRSLTLVAGHAMILMLVSLTVVYIGVQLRDGTRNVPVQYGKRVRGRQIYGGGSTSIPLPLNRAGLVPVAVAYSLLNLILIVGYGLNVYTTGWLSEIGRTLLVVFDPRREVFWFSLFCAVVAWSCFYADVMLSLQNFSDILQKQGGFIPGVRPGQATEEYLKGVSRRTTLAAAPVMGLLVTLIPGILTIFYNQDFLGFIIALLVCVEVITDVVRQLEARITMLHYEGLLK